MYYLLWVLSHGDASGIQQFSIVEFLRLESLNRLAKPYSSHLLSLGSGPMPIEGGVQLFILQHIEYVFIGQTDPEDN